MDENKMFHLKVDGKRLGVRAALLGSVLFSLVEMISIYINTYWIKQIDTPSNQIGWDLFFFILFGVFSFLIAFIPARVGGGILASILCRVQKQHKLSPLNGFLIGAAVGLSAGLMICLPIVVLNYELVITTGHGDSDVFIFRTIMALTIAVSMAGWVGRRLAKQLLTIN